MSFFAKLLGRTLQSTSLAGSALILLTACGGAASSGKTANEGSSSSSSDSWSSESESGHDEAQPSGPNCDDGTCFLCGEGICPRGAYCESDAVGGPACAWLPECSGDPSCGCITGVLGSSCSCNDGSGGPTVSCN